MRKIGWNSGVFSPILNLKRRRRKVDEGRESFVVPPIPENELTWNVPDWRRWRRRRSRILSPDEGRAVVQGHDPVADALLKR